MAVILAGGEGERLSILSQERAKPAVPFGGKYRIIDFTLSNCVNSDIDDVVVLTQYNPRSLNDHIGLGRPWDLDRNRGGVKLLQPYIARGKVAEWYRGTADAVLRNINVIEHVVGRHHRRPRRRPHLQDGLPAVRGRASPPPRRRDDRGPPRAAGRGVADGHPRARRERPGHRVAGEAQAAQERPRVDGRLRLLEEDAPALAVGGSRRLRRQRHPGDARRGRARLRLSLQRLLAGRRDDPVVLGDQHGAPRRQPGARPVRQGLGHPHPLRGTRAGQGRADRPGPQEPDQPRLRHLGDGRELGPVAGRAGRRRGGGPRLDRHVRLGHPLGRGGRPGHPRQGGRRRPGRHRRRWARSTTGRTSRSRTGSTPASRSSASVPSCRAARGSAGTSRSPPTSARPTTPGASSGAANRSTSSGSRGAARVAAVDIEERPAERVVVGAAGAATARGRRLIGDD